MQSRLNTRKTREWSLATIHNTDNCARFSSSELRRGNIIGTSDLGCLHLDLGALQTPPLSLRYDRKLERPRRPLLQLHVPRRILLCNNYSFHLHFFATTTCFACTSSQQLLVPHALLCNNYLFVIALLLCSLNPLHKLTQFSSISI